MCEIGADHMWLLSCPSLKVETFDDDIGPTDDLIGSVKFPLKDIGLESVGAPLECWMVLGEANQSMLHHNRKLHKSPTVWLLSFHTLLNHLSCAHNQSSVGLRTELTRSCPQNPLAGCGFG